MRSADTPYVDGMIQFCVDRYGLSNAVGEGPPAMIVLDGDNVEGLEIRDCDFSVDPTAARDDPVVLLRAHNQALLDNTTHTNLSLRGFSSTLHLQP
jgi:hypothetical protein